MQRFNFVNRTNIIVINCKLPKDLESLYQWIIDTEMSEFKKKDQHTEVDASFGVVRFFGALLLDKVISKTIVASFQVIRILYPEKFNLLETLSKLNHLNDSLILTTKDYWSDKGENLSVCTWEDCLELLFDVFPFEMDSWLSFHRN